MNETLQTQLSEILELGKQGVLQAADMIKEQMPDLVEQILWWELLASVSFFFIGIILLILGIIYTKKAVEGITKEAHSANEGLVIAYGVFAWILPFIVIVSNLTWLKILIAPKLFLIEYISNLVK